jgi:hypothetical protein
MALNGRVAGWLAAMVLAQAAQAEPAADAQALIAALSPERGGDCVLAASVPGAEVLAAMGAAPAWTALCAGQGHPILAADLPQGSAGRRWLEAAARQLLAANGGQALTLVDLAAAEVVTIRPQDGSVDLARAPLPETPPDPTLVFDGSESPDWLPIAYSGGRVEDFLRYGEAGLEVTVPAGNGWGSTGLYSATPILGVPFAWASTGQRLRLRLDPARTTGFVLALVPPESLGRDDWGGHEVRLAYVEPQEGPPQMIAWTRQSERDRVTITDKAALAELSVTVWPGGLLTVQDAAGRMLIQAPTPDLTAGSRMHVYAVASAADAEAPVALALRDIRLDLPEAPPGPDPVAPLGDTTETATLFDGTLYAPRFVRYNAHGGDFARHARLDGGALVVEVPEGAAWGKVGLYSPDPVIWLDRFDGDAEVRLRLDFDAARTSGFVVALSGVHTLVGNDPSNPRFAFHLRRTSEGGLRATRLIDYDQDMQVLDLPGTEMPETVELVLDATGVQVLAPGFPDDALPWGQLHEGAGLRLHVYTHPEAEGQAVAMALRGITLTRRPASLPAVEPLAAPGVEPLPQTVVFDGRPDPRWVPFSFIYEKTFDDLVRYQDGWMVAETPDGSSWGRVGLLSDKPLVIPDRRLQRTPYRFAFTLDPARTDGFATILSTTRVEDMWGSRAVYVALARDIRGAQAGRMRLVLDSGSGSWSRSFDPDWIGANWDGALTLDLSEGWAQVALPGASIRGNAPIYLFGEYHMVMQTIGAGDYDGARAALARVTGGWVTPAFMDALSRMTLLDDADFDPAAFVDLLGGQLTEDLP